MWVEHLVATINPFHWLTIVGLMLVLVVLFTPQGLTGALARFRLLAAYRRRS
jgi:branched-chain amino acid transport system permease protein